MGVGRHRSGLLTAGGVLTVIAGVLAVGMGISGIVYAIWEIWGYWGDPFAQYSAEFCSALGIVFIVLGGIAVAGGISALAVRNWGWALAGAICGLLTTFIPGLLGLIFIIASKRDFA